MNSSRIHRLLRLIGLLQAGKGFNVDTLAEICEVSRRTIFRDIEALRESGFPLNYNEQRQRYCIGRTVCLPETNFTAEEALSLIVLCNELGHSSGMAFFGAARTAALKLESALPSRLREQVRGLVDTVRIHSAPSHPLDEHKQVYEQLRDAAAARQSVRIHYKSVMERETIRTRLDPYRLLFSRRSWYIVGRSSLHRSTRTFHVGRIVDLEPLERRFEIPRGFSIERYLGNAWRLIPEPGPDRDVRIRFAKMVAQNVAEVEWHKTQRLKFNEDGTLDFHVTVSGLSEISWWISGYGDQAEVIAPAELRSVVAERAERTAELYRR